MAYTSVLPVHRLDRSIEYVKDRAKTTKSAGSLEEAIDYALNREKTEQTIFEDAIGCTCENAYENLHQFSGYGKYRFSGKSGKGGSVIRSSHYPERALESRNRPQKK